MAILSTHAPVLFNTRTKSRLISLGYFGVVGQYVDVKVEHLAPWCYSKVLVECDKCGEEVLTRFSSYRLKSTPEYLCPKCVRHRITIKARTTTEQLHKLFSDAGGTYIDEGNYVNSKSKIKYICNLHPEVIQETSRSELIRRGICKFCKAGNIVGKNHYNWKRGATPLLRHLRKRLKLWRLEIKRKNGFRCVISKTRNPTVHHLTAYYATVLDALEQLGLDLKLAVGDYTEDELHKLEDLVVELHHTKVKAVTLSKPLHKLFHQLYGNKKFDYEDDFIEFQFLMRL
jgi:hypothetical protein